MTEEKEMTLDKLKAMMKESKAYEKAVRSGKISKKQAIDDFVKKYPIKIDLNILKQIKEHTLKFVRLFLIVGKDTNLVKTVAICIYSAYKWVHNPTLIEIPVDTKKKIYTSTGMPFIEYSYVGWDYEDIKRHLFTSNERLINHFKEGHMVFLRGLDDTKILKCLVDTFKTEYWGVLIISVPSLNIVPQELLGKFKAIYLETIISTKDEMNQITVNNRTFSNLPDREYKLFKLLYQNKDRYVSKEEILKELNVGGEYDESQIFKLITTLRETFKECPIIFNNKKQSAYNKGGYQLIIK